MAGSALHITEHTIDQHVENMDHLQEVLVAVLARVGLVDASLVGTEEGLDAAVQCVASGVLDASPELTALCSAAMTVHSLFLAAHSERELLLDDFEGLSERLAETSQHVAAYVEARAEERELAAWYASGGKLAEPPPANEEIDSELAAAREELASAAARLARLEGLLVAERPDEVAAGVYSAKGTGPRGHFVHLLQEAGFHKRRIAELLGDVRQLDPAKGEARIHAERRGKGEQVRSEANRVKARLKAWRERA
jgi:hypothetical protein